MPLLGGGLRLLLGRGRVVRVLGRDGGGDEDGEQVQDEGEGAEGVGEHQGTRPLQVQSRPGVSRPCFFNWGSFINDVTHIFPTYFEL